MGIFDFLCYADTLVGLYSSISDKLQDDNKELKKQIRKNIKNICLEIRKSFHNSTEYKFPSDMEDVICNEVIKALENRLPLDLKEVRKALDIPNHIFMPLIDAVSCQLRKALEYSIREHNIENKQDMTEIKSLISGLQKDINTIIQTSPGDSAYDNNKIQIKPNRFHYTAGTVAFLGRDDELTQLKDFCGYNEKMEKHPGNKPFLWWQITGEGGTGKSRLCYEFSMMVRVQGWTICYPPNHSYDCLHRCRESLPNNTLFVLDYSEYNTSDIFRWISEFGTDKYKNILVRVLLIQRTGDTVNDVDIHTTNTNPDDYIPDTVYNEGKFLKLSKLDENEIMAIQKQYAKPTRELTDYELEKLFKVLVSIDKNMRPLYAIIIVDAYLEDPENVLKWSRKEQVLKYICEKEIELIKRSIMEYCQDDFLFESSLAILAMATMVGGIDMANELEYLLPEQYAELQSDSKMKKKFLKIPLLFFATDDSTFCYPLEPDIIGEYFVIYYLNVYAKKRKTVEKMLKSTWGKPSFMSRFVNRLYQDFNELLSDAFYEKYLNVVEIPDSVTIIGDMAFGRYSSLVTVKIPESVTSIGKWAFCGCSSLVTVKIPESVTSIGDMTFSGCSSLTTVEIPESVTCIGDWAFSGCSSLTTVEIPESVTSIGDSAFNGCSSLTAVKIPDTVTSIGDRTFSVCISLVTLKIPETVTSIGDMVFNECSSLTTVEIPETVTCIGDRAFSGCSSLTTVKIPETVTSIGDHAFYRCNRKIFPEWVERKFPNAFWNGSWLKN